MAKSLLLGVMGLMNQKRILFAVFTIGVICDALPASPETDIATTSIHVNVKQKNSGTVLPTTSHNPIWVRSEIMAVNWRRHCITTLLCTEPRLTLANIAPNTNERLVANWRFANYVFMEKPLVLHGYWTSVKRLSDLLIQVSIIGIDPAFRFSRLCDETRTIAVAPSSVIHSTENFSEESVVEQTFELSGSCFNITLQVYAYVGTKCPWTPASENYASGTGSEQLFSATESVTTQHFLSVLVISLLAVGNIAAWYVIYRLRQTNRANNTTADTASKSKISSASYSRSNKLSVNTVSTTARGDNVCLYKIDKSRKRHKKSTKWNYHPSPPSSSSGSSSLSPSKGDCTSPSYSTSSATIRTYPQRNSLTTESSGGVVKLPTTRRCDHCFLRLGGADSTTMAVVSAKIGRMRSSFNDSDHYSTNSYCDCAEMSILFHSSTTGSSLNVSRLTSSQRTTDGGMY